MTARRIACVRRSSGPMERRIRRAKAGFSCSVTPFVVGVSTLPARVLTDAGIVAAPRGSVNGPGVPDEGPPSSDEPGEELVGQEAATERERDPVVACLEEAGVDGPRQRRRERRLEPGFDQDPGCGSESEDQ